MFAARDHRRRCGSTPENVDDKSGRADTDQADRAKGRLSARPKECRSKCLAPELGADRVDPLCAAYPEAFQSITGRSTPTARLLSPSP